MKKGYEPNRPGNISVVWIIGFLVLMICLAYFGAEELRGSLKPNSFGPGMCVGC